MERISAPDAARGVMIMPLWGAGKISEISTVPDTALESA